MATLDFLGLNNDAAPPTKSNKPRRKLVNPSLHPEDEEDAEEMRKAAARRKAKIKARAAVAANTVESDEDRETFNIEREETEEKEKPKRRNASIISSAELDLTTHFEKVSLSDYEEEEGGGGGLPMLNKQTWIEEQLALREDEYTTTKGIRVFIGSYNVNAKKPYIKKTAGSSKSSKEDQQPIDITSWLLPPCEDDVSDNDSDEENQIIMGTPCDIYVIGFQEIVDLNAVNLLAERDDASKHWDSIILQTLNSTTGNNYEQITNVHLVGLSLSLFVRDKCIHHISDVRTGTVGTGIMGVGGNKGAVLIRFDLYKSSLCFINSHLAAHQKRFHARNRDYHNILKKAMLTSSVTNRKRRVYTDPTNKLKILPQIDQEDDEEEEDSTMVNSMGGGSTTTSPRSSSSASQTITVAGREINVGGMKKMLSSGFSALKQGIKTTVQNVNASIEVMRTPVEMSAEEEIKDGLKIWEHDHIIWLGDLNYRINVNDENSKEKAMEDIHKLINAKKWKQLLSTDQLIVEKRRGHAFVGFNEGKIRFAPTYKFVSNTSNYDMDPKKARYPAYCDRIQWCSVYDDSIEQHLYSRSELTVSDHKPVMSILSIPMKKDIASKKKILSAYLEELANDSAQCMPKIALSSTSIECGDVRFEVPVSRELIVKNIGFAVVTFKCESGGARGIKLPKWLNIDPAEGVIHPNQMMTLKINIYVDRRSAYLLNNEEDSVNNPLVLRFTSRHAAEIMMKGSYMKSSLGVDLGWLLKQETPVRPLNAHTTDGRNIDKEKRPIIPFEIYRLVDYIMKAGGTSSRGVWYPPAQAMPEETGKPYVQMIASKEVRYLVELLDLGRPFDLPGMPKLPTHHYVQALLYLLYSLHKPLFYRRKSTKSPNSHNVSNNNSSSTSFSSSSSSSSSKRLTITTAHGEELFNLPQWCYESLGDLPSEHYRCFGFLISFWREVVSHSDTHGMGPEELSMCIAGCVMHKTPDEVYSDSVPATPIQIMEHFLSSKT